MDETPCAAEGEETEGGAGGAADEVAGGIGTGEADRCPLVVEVEEAGTRLEGCGLTEGGSCFSAAEAEAGLGLVALMASATALLAADCIASSSSVSSPPFLLAGERERSLGSAAAAEAEEGVLDLWSWLLWLSAEAPLLLSFFPSSSFSTLSWCRPLLSSPAKQ